MPLYRSLGQFQAFGYLTHKHTVIIVHDYDFALRFRQIGYLAADKSAHFAVFKRKSDIIITARHFARYAVERQMRAFSVTVNISCINIL